MQSSQTDHFNKTNHIPIAIAQRIQCPVERGTATGSILLAVMGAVRDAARPSAMPSKSMSPMSAERYSRLRMTLAGIHSINDVSDWEGATAAYYESVYNNDENDAVDGKSQIRGRGTTCEPEQDHTR